MKKVGLTSLIAALVLLLTGTACHKLDEPYQGEFSQVFVYMGLGYNNLSLNLKDDLMELKDGVLPELGRDKAVLAFCHNTARSGDYLTPNPPCLLRLYRMEGIGVIDTLKVYPSEMISASAESIRTVLSDVKELFPSESYSMLLSSHSTGWIPPQYRAGTEQWSLSPRQMGIEGSESEWSSFPATKSIGAQSSPNNVYEIELKDFAAAIPMKMDYILFDACLCGGIELAWELRDVCDKIVFSPTEVLTMGFQYSSMIYNLMNGKEAELEQVCRDYFELYDAQSGNMRSATISLVDCRKLDALASEFTRILESHPCDFGSFSRSGVQKYFYDNKAWFFDLRDFVRGLGATASELSALDAALSECVLCHFETPSFFNVPMERCCGLSVYIPNPNFAILNDYYRTLGWNSVTGLVK